MSGSRFTDYFCLSILEEAHEMVAIEELQRTVWPGNETDVVPGHLLLAATHHGGLVIGAYQINEIRENKPLDFPQIAFSGFGDLPAQAQLVGFVFGFPGMVDTPNGPQLKHYSHMLAVHPSVRDYGIGFALKRAQWQMIRRSGVDCINWTFDPLLSRNAYLNISRLGAVCNTYIADAYGVMLDGLNAGLPSDRFQVDWWINTPRVSSRLSRRPRLKLDLAHFLAAETKIINPSRIGANGLPHPPDTNHLTGSSGLSSNDSLVLVEIPADFLHLKSLDMGLASDWRFHIRAIFEGLFAQGFFVTDFIHLVGKSARSFYVLSDGDRNL